MVVGGSIEVGEVDAGLDAGRPVLTTHLNDVVHPPQIERDAALHWHDRAHDAGAAAVGHDRYATLRGERHHRRDLRRTRWTRDCIHARFSQFRTSTEPVGSYGVERQPLTGLVVSQDVLIANDGGEGVA